MNNQEPMSEFNVRNALKSVALFNPIAYAMIKGYIDYLELRVNAQKDEEEEHIICPNCGRIKLDE